MRRWAWVSAALLLAGAACAGTAQRVDEGSSSHEGSYLGFDRNDYPGDATLSALRKSFRYTGYWLNHPPGETQNSWTGKRAILRKHGFGFLVLFNGRTDAELKAAAAKGKDVALLGAADGRAAVATALREGFPTGVLIFLDQEEGGRLLPEQATYLFAWVDAVRGAGARAGVYCSGIAVPNGNATISTAQDIAKRETARMLAGHSSERENRGSRLALWVANDQCPPAPGCFACRAAFDCGAGAGDCGIRSCLAVCAVAAAEAVQRQLPREPGPGRQLLRAGAGSKCEHLRGSGHGRFARPIGVARFRFFC